jgi:hypothetical protein
MIKSLRNIALLGEGITNFNEKYIELERENPTEAVIIDPDGIVNAYTYDGFAFLNETWYKKYSKKWQDDSSEIDRLLVNRQAILPPETLLKSRIICQTHPTRSQKP